MPVWDEGWSEVLKGFEPQGPHRTGSLYGIGDAYSTLISAALISGHHLAISAR